jgi:hypothetical protein
LKVAVAARPRAQGERADPVRRRRLARLALPVREVRKPLAVLAPAAAEDAGAVRSCWDPA